MRKINVNNLGSVQLVSKFVCKNTIVMYHLIVDGNNVFVPSCMFDSWMQYLDIELTGMSKIQRVNVFESNFRYVIKDDSNSQDIRFRYANIFTGTSSDVQLLDFTFMMLKKYFLKERCKLKERHEFSTNSDISRVDRFRRNALLK